MKFETLAFGYGLIEAPRVDEQNRLCFSDVQKGGVYRRSPDGAIQTLIPKRRGVGGIAFNEGDGLVLTGRGLIHWSEKTRTSRDIFIEFEGRKLAGLNDLTTDDRGSVYTGSVEYSPFDESAKRTPGALFRIDPPGKAVKLWEGIELSNGLGLSPDRNLLYHSDSQTGAVWAYDVASDRSVRDRRVFARMPEGSPDGLAVDAEGGVWVAAYRAGEVVRFHRDGTLDRRIRMPANNVTSLVFGGRDMMDLYVVTADNSEDPDCGGTIFRTRSDIAGLAVPKARF
jgi:sugar lactone lactonase YvrE